MLKINESIVKEVAMLLPNLAVLIGKLAMDSRVPAETKFALAAGAAYIVSPIDFVPDFIPGFGQAEDVIVALLLVDGIVNSLDPTIVEEHWRGDPATLNRIRSLARTSTSFLPEALRNFIMNRAFHNPKNPVTRFSKLAGARSS